MSGFRLLFPIEDVKHYNLYAAVCEEHSRLDYVEGFIYIYLWSKVTGGSMSCKLIPRQTNTQDQPFLCAQRWLMYADNHILIKCQ